jgi:magnesium-transporting ATPase (P-type)
MDALVNSQALTFHLSSSIPQTVPCDLQVLTREANVVVNEAMLTGESVPVIRSSFAKAITDVSGAHSLLLSPSLSFSLLLSFSLSALSSVTLRKDLYR